MTDLQKHVALLRQYNAWRQDNPDNPTPLEMPNPREVGIALDAVLDAVDKLREACEIGREYIEEVRARDKVSGLKTNLHDHRLDQIDAAMSEASPPAAG